MKRKMYYIGMVAMLSLSGCSRGCNKMSRTFEAGDRHYELDMYSGGESVFHDEFSDIVNNSGESDGIYYYKGDTLVEISGDYVIKSVD